MPRPESPGGTDAYQNVTLRLPKELVTRYKGWAMDEDRSLTEQVIHILRHAHPKPPRPPARTEAAAGGR